MSHSIDEHYSVYNETYPVARKSHQCDACQREIRAGDQYARVFVLFDGTSETFKRCLRCQHIHLHLRDIGSCDDMWPAERLDCGEEYSDHWGVEPPEELQSLAFMTDDDAQKELRLGK